MNKYEAIFIIRPDLSEDEKKTLFNQIGEAVIKNQGQVSSGAIWSEKRKLYFPIKKHQEGAYYLLSFSLPPLLLKEVRRTYSLNENILRSLFTKLE